jgi:hypothetical protein
VSTTTATADGLTADRAAIDADSLLAMSPADLDDLFRQSEAGPIPAGRGRGTVIVFPGTEVSRPAARALGAIFWHGKVFDPETRTLKNLVSPLGVRAIEAQFYPEESWFDARRCTVLDYSKTSRVAGWIRDEIREVGPGLYLGLVWGVGRAFGGRRRLLRFALTFPPAA